MATAADPLELRLLYSPHRPEPKQHAYLLLDELGIEEALYGGAAGGGKSDTLLMSALRYVDVPGYAALLLRRSYQDLALPGALMDRAKEWLIGTDARWSEKDFRFTFPSSATLSFGYLQHSNDRYRYASAEFQFIGFDELTQFEEADYTFLFSRLRRPEIPDDAPEQVRKHRELLSHVPLRMRTASNPGGRGHEWVKRRYVDRLPSEDDPDDTLERARRRIFIPASLKDNPHVDREGYRRMLANLTRVERLRLEQGDWNADDGSKYLNGNGLDACVEFGRELDYLAARGEAPPPAGDLLALGLDWGDHTAYVYGWPLEAGGLWAVLADELVGFEPGAATDRILAAIGRVPAWEGLGVVKEPLALLSDVRYDAAGLQSQRTFNARARRRHPLKAQKIAFSDYKRATALYMKSLVERAAHGHRTRVLAISPGCRKLITQLRGLQKDPKDPELWLKENDHGPDSLVALLAPIARRNRGQL
jgi:hypothetical protein